MQIAISVKNGLVARFFHPRTFGVMHSGKVVRVKNNGKSVYVHFDIDDRTWQTHPEHILAEKLAKEKPS